MKILLKIGKIILKYILIFITVLLIAFGLLVATAKIPKQAIMEKMQESVSFFKKMREWKRFRREESILDCIIMLTQY